MQTKVCTLLHNHRTVFCQLLFLSLLSYMLSELTLIRLNNTKLGSEVRTIENRIYIRGKFTRKKCKTAILLYCFHTAGVLHIFML